MKHFSHTKIQRLATQCLKYGASLPKWVVTNEKWAAMMVVTYNMNGVDMLTMQTNIEWATLVEVYAL